MSFYSTCETYLTFDLGRFFSAVTDKAVRQAALRETLRDADFLSLLSPRAAGQLEVLAQQAQATTIRHFGRVIYLYAPLYVSNHCDNDCPYCGFKRTNAIVRRKLALEEVEREAQAIAAAGMRHILILTGESRLQTPLSYIKDCITILARHFSSIAVEIYPLDEAEYAELVAAGTDGLTIYQETYDESLYRRLHPNGPKSDYRFRLDAPQRAARAGMRSISIGALLGLGDFRKEVFLAGLHAAYLQKAHGDVEISVSLPRIQPEVGGFQAAVPVADRDLVQALLALRLYLPRAGINISTRERHDFRSSLIGLGVTRMSAGSRTEVGGYSLAGSSEGQFETADKSSVGDVRKMIEAKGYQPVMKDWQIIS